MSGKRLEKEAADLWGRCVNTTCDCFNGDIEDEWESQVESFRLALCSIVDNNQTPKVIPSETIDDFASGGIRGLDHDILLYLNGVTIHEIMDNENRHKWEDYLIQLLYMYPI